MEQAMFEYINGLEDEVIGRWQYENPGVVQAIRRSCGHRQERKLYHACFHGMISVALCGDLKQLGVATEAVAALLDSLQPGQESIPVQLVVGLKNAIILALPEELGRQLFPLLDGAADQLAASCIRHISAHLAKLRSRLRRKDAELKRRNWELSILNRSSMYINSTLNLQQVLESILTQVSKIMFTDTCSIYELDRGKGQLRIIAQRGLTDEYAKKIVIPVGDGVAGKAVQTVSTVALENVQKEWTWEKAPSYIQPLLAEINFGAILVAPLVCRDEMLGCICVYHRRPHRFTRAEHSLLAIFADHAAVAIDNARLLQKEKELAIADERNRIARDLHDSVCQAMFSLVLNAEACRYLVSSNDNARAVEAIDQLRNVATEALAEMRSLVFELRPWALKEKGLMSALADLATLYKSRHGIEVKLRAEEAPRLPEEIELCLYRVTQEAMTNVAKHAEATIINIALRFTRDTVSLTVADDGKGFDTAAAQQQCHTMGLAAMRERVEDCGGTMSIRSSPGRGTVISVNVPIRSGVS